jgi:hypothetical protein
MEMFLMALALSLLGVAVSAGLFAAATASERRAGLPAPAGTVRKAQSPRFFAAPPPPAIPKPFPIPAEVLLLRLERHIRLEQAAAESFHQAPTPEALHSRTASPLVLH